MKINDKVIFVKNELKEDLIGQSGVITKIFDYTIPPSVQVLLDENSRFVLAQETELKVISR